MDIFIESQRERLLERQRTYLNPAFSGTRIPEAVLLKQTGLRFIETALARIDAGEYELCICCGGDIDRRRHERVPGATRCFACQVEYESTSGR